MHRLGPFLLAAACGSEPPQVEPGLLEAGRVVQEAARAGAAAPLAAAARCEALVPVQRRDHCVLAVVLANAEPRPELDGLCATVRTPPWQLECAYHLAELQQPILDPLALAARCTEALAELGSACALHGLDQGLRACRGERDPARPARCWFRPDVLEAQLAALQAATGAVEGRELERLGGELRALAASGQGRWLEPEVPPWW